MRTKNVLLAVVMAFIAVTGFGQTWQIGSPNAADVTATLDGNTLTISGTGDMMDFISTDDADEASTPWDDIHATITSLIINEGITRIGDYAFMNFSGITSITIPESITSIGNDAFSKCTSLSTVNYNAENCTRTGPSYLPFGADTPVQTLNIGNNVKFIPNNLFNHSLNITSVVIPDNVETIDYWAFGNCTNLQSVTIGNKCDSIGHNAFNGCSSLTEITIPEKVRSIGDAAFINCTSLSTVNYNAENCLHAGFSYVLFWNSLVQTANIGNNVKFIPNNLFNKCENLTSVVIPDNVEKVDYWAFGNCTNLQSVTIGAKCSDIEYAVFGSCTALSTIKNMNPVPQSISSNDVFSGITNLGSITLHVPFGSQAAYEAADVWKNFNIVDDADDDVMAVVVMKGDAVVFQSTVLAIDSVIFYDPANPAVIPSNEALLIYKAGDTSFDKLLLSDIQKLSFSDINLSIEKWNAESLLYAFSDVKKLGFYGIPTSISFPGQNKLEVIAYFTMAGDLVVKSPAGVKSLTLYSIDGKIVTARYVPTGIYILRVETSQGVFVKKLIKH